MLGVPGCVGGEGGICWRWGLVLVLAEVRASPRGPPVSPGSLPAGPGLPWPPRDCSEAPNLSKLLHACPPAVSLSPSWTRLPCP